MGKIEKVRRTALCIRVRPEKMPYYAAPYSTAKSWVRPYTTLLARDFGLVKFKFVSLGSPIIQINALFQEMQNSN